MLKLRFDENGSFKPQDGSTHFEATPWPIFNWMSFTLVNDSFACLWQSYPDPPCYIAMFDGPKLVDR